MNRHDRGRGSTTKARTTRSRQGNDVKRRWTRDEEKLLKVMARQNTPTRMIGQKLGRTEYSVRSKASELAISLRPSGRSQYG